MFWFFDHEACGILAPWPGFERANLDKYFQAEKLL